MLHFLQSDRELPRLFRTFHSNTRVRVLSCFINWRRNHFPPLRPMAASRESLSSSWRKSTICLTAPVIPAMLGTTAASALSSPDSSCQLPAAALKTRCSFPRSVTLATVFLSPLMLRSGLWMLLKPKDIHYIDTQNTLLPNFHSPPHHTTSQALKTTRWQYVNAHMPIIYTRIAIQICITINHLEQQKATAIFMK